MIIEPLPGYLFSNGSKRKFITDPDSIDGCLSFLEGFCDKALQTDYNVWSFVNFDDYEKIYSEWTKSYKAVKIASDVESSSSVGDPVFLPGKLSEQRQCPAQRTRIDDQKNPACCFCCFIG